jgi:AcrR family transcriptional regulator
MKDKKVKKPLGRPRKFEIDSALDKALEVFRRKGYEATSLTDITEALGINRPSLYAAFGNKEELFAKALTKYMQGPISYLTEVLNEKTSYEVVKQMLLQSVDLLTGMENSKGCLVIQSSISSELQASGIQQKLVEGLANNDMRIKERFDRAIKEGDLPTDIDSSALAKYVTTIHKGMSMQAINGASKEELYRVVDLVLKGWPGKH